MSLLGRRTTHQEHSSMPRHSKCARACLLVAWPLDSRQRERVLFEPAVVQNQPPLSQQSLWACGRCHVQESWSLMSLC